MDVDLAMVMIHGISQTLTFRILFFSMSFFMETQGEDVEQGIRIQHALHPLYPYFFLFSHQTGWTALAARCLDKIEKVYT